MTCHSEEDAMEEVQNCRNCGAPLDKNGDCEYCGTRRQRRQGSQIEVTATSIRLWSGDQLVDDGEDDAEADK